jgi:hypothetical protein
MLRIIFLNNMTNEEFYVKRKRGEYIRVNTNLAVIDVTAMSIISTNSLFSLQLALYR